MKSRARKLLVDALALFGILVMLILLARGQVAATLLILPPMILILFGKRRDA